MKNKKLIISITIIMITITTLGLSFAYYIARFNILNKDNSSSNIIAGSIVEAILEIPTKDDNINILPGNKFSKEYIVKGKGDSNSLSTLASLIVKTNLGDFKDYVKWSLYKSSNEITCEKNTCNIPEGASLVLSGSFDSKSFSTYINYDTNDKYYLITEYVNSDKDQSDLMNKTFNIDVSLEPAEDSIQNKIIAQLDTTGKCPTVNEDGSVNVTSAEAENAYLCSAIDAYGTSYYYRGTVENNYVYFAGYYFRIVRINGDGSIRLIYDGTSAHQNGEVSKDRITGETSYNKYWKNNNVQVSTQSFVYKDAAGAGYMYGNRDKIIESNTSYPVSFTSSSYYISKNYEYDAVNDKFILKDPILVTDSDITEKYLQYYTFLNTNIDYSSDTLYRIALIANNNPNSPYSVHYMAYGTSSMEQAQTNTNDSDIKVFADTWYKKNILGTNYEQFLADNIFCDDRTIISTSNFSYNGLDWFSYKWVDHKHTIQLICPQQNDAFTVSDITKGNEALTYPIAYLSADEYALAGSWDSDNRNYFLYVNELDLPITPSYHWGYNSQIRRILSGRIDYDTYASGTFGVRVVINLKPDSLKHGTGTMDNPYTVE